MRIHKLLSLWAAGLLLAPLSARAEITFDGTVVARDAVSVTAPFGGMVSDVAVKAGLKSPWETPFAPLRLPRCTRPLPAPSAACSVSPGTPWTPLPSAMARCCT